MSGCKFIVNEIIYEVDTVETEKTLHTSFGDYRPDIIVTTTSGKIFYFEIRVTNRKTELYAPKWDELGNDVVEVDTRYFINQKYKNDIPVFDLIYSEGNCYIKSYTRKDYDHLIGTRKVEWKRQGKLDYKFQWERLDWFWNALSEYKKDASKKDSVIESFSAMDISDRIWCYQNIKGKSCVDIKTEFEENINQYYVDQIENLAKLNNNLCISAVHISPLIYKIYIRYNIPYDDYQCHIETDEKVKMKHRLFICNDDIITKVKSDILRLSNEADEYIIQLNCIKKFLKLPYIASIHPKSHDIAKENDLLFVPFVIEYTDHIHNRYISETIGTKTYYMFGFDFTTCKVKLSITKSILENDYKMFKNSAMQNLDIEIQSNVLRNISELKDYINNARNTNNCYLSYHKNQIITKPKNIYEEREVIFILDNKTNINTAYKTVFHKTYYRNRKIHLIKSVMQRYMNKINQCSNGIWKIENNGDNEYTITIWSSDGYGYETYFSITEPYSKNSIERQLCSVMNELASGLYSDIRLLEVNDNIE